MAHRPDDELILHFYGEHDAPEELERALASDPELAGRYAALRRELSGLDRLAAPAPRPGLEGRMWARIEPALAPAGRHAVPRWGWLAAAAVLAFAAFLAGRWIPTTPGEIEVAQAVQGLSPEARDRVLKAALADHLDSSQRLLIEFANGAPDHGEERLRAAELLSANRLYRRAAERAGDRRVAAVLAELEVLLGELAQSPAGVDPQSASDEMLFKVRIARNNLKGIS